MNMEYARMRIYGRVQMVMFRDFVRRGAGRLELAGYVKNLPDGSLEIIARGDKDKVRELFERAKRGPVFACVDKYEMDTISLADEFRDFKILY